MVPAVLYPLYLTFNKTDISPRRTHSTAEMPTSGDLKSGVYLFCTTPNGFPRFRQIDPAPNGNDLWHYMKSYMRYILSKFTTTVLNVRNNLWQWLNTCKNAPETILRIRKIQVLSKQWAKSQTKALKSSKDEFIWEIWLPLQESGRSVVLYLGELACVVLVPKLSNYHKLTINIWPLRPPFLFEFPLLQPHMYKKTGFIIFTQHSNLWLRNLPNVLQKGLLRGLITLFHLANLQSSHPHEMEACAVIKVPKRINKDRI